MPSRAHTHNPGPAPLLAAAAALLLLVSLFLDWFESAEDANGDGATAWTAFEIHDLLLAAIGLLALWRAAHLLGALRDGPPVRFWQLGAAALVIVVSQLINKPPIAQVGEINEAVGIWLALAASVLLLIAGLMNRVRVELVHDDTSRHAVPGARPDTPAAPGHGDAVPPAGAGTNARIPAPVPTTPPATRGPGAATPPAHPGDTAQTRPFST
jgi:hypothetical protein